MYPKSNANTRPVPPARADFQPNPQEERLLPQVPERMDRPEQNSSTTAHQVIKN
jgi:hypothetical protein